MSDAPPKRPRGRPKVDEPGTKLFTYVRTSDFDRLVKQAMKEDRTVSALVRDLLHLKLR